MGNRIAHETVLDATMRLGQDQTLRAAEMAQNTAKLCMAPPKQSTFSEGVALAAATWQRSVALQASWVNDWAQWGQFAQSIQGADTVPKYVDRVGNIFLQAEAQMTSQMAEYSELLDNIGVSYAYWLTQQVDGQD